MLAFVGQLQGRLIGRAGFGGLAGLPELVAAPCAHRRDEEDSHPDDEVAVALPQLLELFSPYFLVDFIEDIGHEKPLRPRARDRPGQAGAAPAVRIAVWRRHGKAPAPSTAGMAIAS
jgi:hypothetical protein